MFINTSVKKLFPQETLQKFDFPFSLSDGFERLSVQNTPSAKNLFHGLTDQALKFISVYIFTYFTLGCKCLFVIRKSTPIINQLCTEHLNYRIRFLVTYVKQIHILIVQNLSLLISTRVLWCSVRSHAQHYHILLKLDLHASSNSHSSVRLRFCSAFKSLRWFRRFAVLAIKDSSILQSWR